MVNSYDFRGVIVSSGFEHLMEHSESTEDKRLASQASSRQFGTPRDEYNPRKFIFFYFYFIFSFFGVCVCVRVFFLSLLFLLFDRALAAPRRASPFPSCAAPFRCCFQVAGRAFDFV